MRVVAVAEGYSSGHYRVRQPIRALSHDPSVQATIAEEGLPIVFSRQTRRFVSCDVEADVLLLMRPQYWFMPDLIRHVRKRGIRVVVDVDDDFHSVHGLNGDFRRSHPKLSPLSNFNFLRRCCAEADLVTVSTPALARRYGGHGRVAVLRNCVDDDWLEIPRKPNRKLIVGWGAAMSNHPNDPGVTHGGVGAAVEECGARFLSVGGEKRLADLQRALGLSKRPDATPWVDLELYPYLLARLDVGIVPLARTQFNAAKSWLKGIEYSALGIPFVASPTPEYEQLAGIGLGILADDRRRAWRRSLRSLLEDPDLAARGARAREIVREHLTISTNAWRWAEAWEAAMVRELDTSHTPQSRGATRHASNSLQRHRSSRQAVGRAR